MKLSPWMLGVAVLVPVAGAVIGSHMDTNPAGARSDVTDALPISPTIAHASESTGTQPRLPDHYAMETPDGVVEVHELAMRGRLHDRYRAEQPYGYSYEQDIAALEDRYDHDDLDARAELALAPDLAPAGQSDAYSAQPPQRQTPHYAAMEQARTGEDIESGATQIADGVIEIEPAMAQNARPKVINVASELAALN